MNKSHISYINIKVDSESYVVIKHPTKLYSITVSLLPGSCIKVHSDLIVSVIPIYL